MKIHGFPMKIRGFPWKIMVFEQNCHAGVIYGCQKPKVVLYSVLMDCVGVCGQLFLEKVFEK